MSQAAHPKFGAAIYVGSTRHMSVNSVVLVALVRTYAALLAGANRMNWSHFSITNALGEICWPILFGGGADLFGEQVKRVAGPVRLLLFVSAIGLVAAGIMRK